MKGDEEEDEDELEKKELEEHERKAKHSIEGILGDRCECARTRLTWLVAVAGRRGEGSESISPGASGPRSELVSSPLTQV